MRVDRTRRLTKVYRIVSSVRLPTTVIDGHPCLRLSLYWHRDGHTRTHKHIHQHVRTRTFVCVRGELMTPGVKTLSGCLVGVWIPCP